MTLIVPLLLLALAPPPAEAEEPEPSSAEASETAAEEEHHYPEARLYDPEIDAAASVDAALARASERKVNTCLLYTSPSPRDS